MTAHKLTIELTSVFRPDDIATIILALCQVCQYMCIVLLSCNYLPVDACVQQHNRDIVYTLYTAIVMPVHKYRILISVMSKSLQLQSYIAG